MPVVIFPYGYSLSIHPVGDEQVRVACATIVAVARPDDLLAIGREHGEGVEDALRGDLRQARSIEIDHVELEVVAPRRMMIRREDDPLVVGREALGSRVMQTNSGGTQAELHSNGVARKYCKPVPGAGRNF